MSDEQSPMTPEYGLPTPPQFTMKPGAEEPPRLSTIQRITTVFLSPGEVFQDVNRKASPLIPLLLIGALALSAGLLFGFLIKTDPRDIARAAVEKQFEKQGK